MKLKIRTYASVKEVFGESFELELDGVSTVGELKKKIISMRPESAGLINICRFAVRETIVNDKTQIKEDEHVHIIPPASGG
ncbi:MAG: MoaD/ThiS family protein [Ignavibacteriaceae bacterium]|nr:MoaD/ThiS family protein [Ignavibacteriaceae bacterium]